MTLFGKILLFFNLLLAAGFVYLATQDWKGRQTITAAGLRHVLLVSGLPLGAEPNAPASVPNDAEAEIPFRVETAGGFPTRTVSPKFLETYFANNAAGNTPLGQGSVPNQLAEVKRVKAHIDQQLGSADGQAARTALLRDWLLLQAETYDERVTILDLVGQQNVEELQKRLNARFAAVIDPPKPPSADAIALLPPAAPEDVDQLQAKIAQVDAARSIPQEEDERRARIAHLLVHLTPDPAWQKRVQAVVGARRYVSAVAAQSDRFRVMADRVESLILPDQEGYLADESTQKQLAINRTGLAAAQAQIKLRWQEQKRKEDDFVARRTTELDAIKAQLRKVKAEVDELLVRQSGIEAALFEVQREVALTLDEVYQLESRLEARERELLRLPPKPKGN